jgi:hypothetical protein
MEKVKGWANYVSQGYRYALQETWQLGNDAVTE